MLIKYYDIIILSKTCKDLQDMNMRARITVFSFIAIIILVSQISSPLASFSSSIAVAASGTIIYVKPKTILKSLVVYPYTITDDLASFIGSHFDLVDFDWGATYNFQKIKTANPNITMIGYRDFMYMPTWYSDWSIVNQTQNEDWFLHTKYGNTSQYRMQNNGGGAYVMNISSIGWRNYLANWVSKKLATYPMIDGIFADDVGEAIIFSPSWTNPFNVPLTDLDPSVISNWNTNMAGLLQTVKTAMGSKLLIINTPDLNGFLIQYCDGQMIEHFLHRSHRSLTDYTQTKPIGEMNLLEQLSATGKIVMAFSGAIIPQNPTQTDIELTHKCMLYSLCGFLLAYSGMANYGFQFLHTDYTGHNCYWDEMDASIGTPVGAKYNVQGDLWARDFTAGRVFLNIGDLNTYTVDVGGTNYTITPRSGLIVPA